MSNQNNHSFLDAIKAGDINYHHQLSDLHLPYSQDIIRILNRFPVIKESVLLYFDKDNKPWIVVPLVYGEWKRRGKNN